MMNKTFHIKTFGCQMNRLDSEMLEAALCGSGYRVEDDPARASVLIYNTCSVRRQAEHRVFSHLGRWRQRAQDEPGFVLVVVGCMAQRLAEELTRRYPFVRLVCGTRAFLKVPGYLDRIAASGETIVDIDDRPLAFERSAAHRSESHHAYVSIMRGCSNCCTYCVVPSVRGPEVSRARAEIVDEVKRLADDGVVEVTLLGQNVNAYGRCCADGADGGLPRLLHDVGALESIRRIRFLTSHPRDMTDDILAAVASVEKVCEHLHMPAQSASDTVLKAMNRNYSRAQYIERADAARRIVPGVALSSDFIVGFPGETDRDFEATLSLVQTQQFQQSYIFRYSPRPDTPAADRRDDVPDAVKRRRQQQLLEAQQRVDRQRRNALTGHTLEVMCTGPNRSCPHEGRWMGRSRLNDIVVFDAGADGRSVAAGAVVDVRIRHATPLTLFGVLPEPVGIGPSG